MANEFSDVWFRTFLDSIEVAQTEREVEFITHQLPLRSYKRVVDLCCGSGRHARLLAARGYDVTGIDQSRTALSAARRAGPPEVVYVEGDMRDGDAIPSGTDGVLCMWQSFGYFDAAANDRVLGNVSRALRRGGRLVLDVYNREYFEARQGTLASLRGGDGVSETRTMYGPRLKVEVRYPHEGAMDTFDWHLYTAPELIAAAARSGLRDALVCANWDGTTKPSPELGRMQLIFEKAA